MGRYADAERSLRDAINLEEKAGGARRAELGTRLLSLSRLLQREDRLADADATFVRARDVYDSVLPETDVQRVSVRNELGNLLLEREKPEAAEDAFRSALAIDEKRSARPTEWRSVLLQGLGLAYRDEGRFAEARQTLLEAVSIEEKGGEERKTFLSDSLTALAGVLRRQGDYPEAEAALQRALAIAQQPLSRAATLNSLGLDLQFDRTCSGTGRASSKGSARHP